MAPAINYTIAAAYQPKDCLRSVHIALTLGGVLRYFAGMLAAMPLTLLAACAATAGDNRGSSTPSFRLAYTTYTDEAGVVVQVAEGMLHGGPPRITPDAIVIPGDSRGAGQLALAPGGHSLAFVVWRTGSVCAANPDPKQRGGCWALETWSIAGEGSSETLVAMQGGAGRAGQPVWSPDGQHIAFVTQATGSNWNLTVVTVATKFARTVAQIYVPENAPGVVDDPPLAWAGDDTLPTPPTSLLCAL